MNDPSNGFKRRFRLWQEFSPRVFILALAWVALALRLYRLGAQDLWGDEAFSIQLSSQPLSQIIAGGADTHPPFYPVLLYVWLQLTGSIPFATRALSALLGTLLVPLLFATTRRMAPGRRGVAWFAATLAAVSPLLVYYSQETRMYELVTLLVLFSAYAALRVISRYLADEHPIADETFYLIATGLALYTHYYAFSAWFGVNLFAGWQLRKKPSALNRWGLIQLALIVAYIPWVLVQSSFLGGKASARLGEWGWSGIELVFGRTLLAFSGGLTVEFPVAQFAGLVLLGLAGLGLVAIFRARDSWLWLAPLYGLLPVVIAWVLNPILPFFYERYVLLALPGWLVLVAFGLDALYRKSAPAACVLMVLTLGVSGVSLANYYHNDAFAKGKYGQMMAYVAGAAQPGDALILNNPLQKPLFNYYRPTNVQAFFLPDGVALEDPGTRKELANIAAAHTRVWLVMYGNPAEYDPTGYLERWLGANAFRAMRRGFVDASLSLYVMPGTQPEVFHVSMRATLGNIVLVGYDLDRKEVVRGGTVRLTLHWVASDAVTKRYTVFTHLIPTPASGRNNPATGSPVWAQMDGEPVGGSRPTNSWSPGEPVGDSYGLLLPDNIPPGEYWLEVGMYDPMSLERLPVLDENGRRLAEDRVLLGPLRVVEQ